MKKITRSISEPEEIFSSKEVTRLDGRCTNCGTSELLKSEKDVMKFWLEHQGHTVSIFPLKPRKSFRRNKK